MIRTSMSSTIKKISVILISVILLPILLYSIFELNSLTEDEKEIRAIYEQQLKAILYSINQYSEDIINSVTLKIEDNYTEQKLDSAFLSTLFQQNYSFAFIHFKMLGKSWKEDIYFNPFLDAPSSLIEEIKKLHEDKKEVIERLVGYQQRGYSKKEPIGRVNVGNLNYNALSFVFQVKDQPILCTLIFDSVELIEQILVPKVQGIAREEFAILIRDVETQTQIYQTEAATNPDVKFNALWLLPEYEVGINSLGKSIQSIIEERRLFNLTSVGLLIFFLISGVFLLFRNIRREVELAQNKSEFVSNVSHEIRTPLALINMFAETLLLDRVKTEEKKKEYYEIITKEISRLTNIVNRILNFSQIEANKKNYDFEELCLTDLIESILHTYSFHLKNNGFEFSFERSEVLPKIQGDKETITEAVVNLLENAMKYSPERKEIKVLTGEQNQMVYLEIQDKGMGISPKQVKQIFEKFYRVPQGNIHNIKGSGLGLSLVKHIMDAHRGKVEVKSTLGQGSSFRLLFPMNKK